MGLQAARILVGKRTERSNLRRPLDAVSPGEAPPSRIRLSAKHWRQAVFDDGRKDIVLNLVGKDKIAKHLVPDFRCRAVDAI